jgi:pyruvate dehydrogenase (quinone)
MMGTRGPFLLEAEVDTHEPPMPPKATLSQGLKMAKALASGTPDGGKIARRIGVDVVREVV